MNGTDPLLQCFMDPRTERGVKAVKLRELGAQIATIYEGRLWRQKRNASGVLYRRFEDFCAVEIGLSFRTAYGLMDLYRYYDAEKVRLFGSEKLIRVLRAPEVERPGIMAKIEAGASVRDVRRLVKAAKKKHGVALVPFKRRPAPASAVETSTAFAPKAITIDVSPTCCSAASAQKLHELRIELNGKMYWSAKTDDDVLRVMMFCPFCGTRLSGAHVPVLPVNASVMPRSKATALRDASPRGAAASSLSRRRVREEWLRRQAGRTVTAQQCAEKYRVETGEVISEKTFLRDFSRLGARRVGSGVYSIAGQEA